MLFSSSSQFHVTTAGKEGADGGDLEAALSRAARALWEHIHDQIPSSDGKRDKLTSDQFLDTWASLIDYIIKNGKIPKLVQDLVDIGFNLYSTKSGDNIAPTIPSSAFEKLFQKMNLGHPYALMAHKFLTEVCIFFLFPSIMYIFFIQNGTKPLDADKVNSIVRAVITSSDDGHNSQFLLPGFYKTIANKGNERDTASQTPPPGQGKLCRKQDFFSTIQNQLNINKTHLRSIYVNQQYSEYWRRHKFQICKQESIPFPIETYSCINSNRIYIIRSIVQEITTRKT